VDAPYSARSFADTVLRDYASRRTVFETAMKASAGSPVLETRRMGHPDFDDLEVGERRSADIACVFLDLTDFTGRSFWDDPGEVTDLAHAVITGFVEVIGNFGGYPLGLRGDGVFAGFGPANAALSASFALAACAFALDAVDREVNPRLTDRGIAQVKARAGLDYGEITFVRSGTSDHSEVNPLGFAANFAAKCEKYANSWEIVVGEGLTQHLGDTSKFHPHSQSPKTYQRNYQSRRYAFYDWQWRTTVPHLATAAAELNNRPVHAIGIG
jgi:adenylate cyclase